MDKKILFKNKGQL